MAGPWEAFQDSTAQTLSQNDAAIVPPPRAAVAPSKRIWGDAEAQQAGIYEGATPGPWDAFKAAPQQVQQDRAPLRITVNPVADRFGAMTPPETGAPELQRGLDQRGLEMNRGPEVSPAAQMAGGHANALAAASQRTSPDVSQYGGKLLSTQAFEDDAGNIHYLDPETKKLKPVEAKSQVAIRDPADGTVKVFARSDATDESGFTGAARLATQGMLTGAPTARASLPSTAKVIPRPSDTFSAAKPLYREFDAEAARSAPMVANQAKVMVDRIQNALDVAHLPSEVAKQVHDTVGLIGKKANGETALAQLQYLKRAVGNLFKSPDENVRSGAAVASKEIGRMISDESRVAGETLKKADAIHSTARAQQDLQRKGDIANLRTSRAGYGGNAVNNMRTAVEKIVEASVNGRQTPYKPNEIQAMRDITNGDWLTNTARNIGSMAPSKGIFAIGMGTASLGTTAVAGSAANRLATVLTGRQLERLNDLVSKRSPAYAEAVSKAVQRFEKAQIELANNPSPNRLSAYVSASRALSSGLSRDGIPITSADLMRSIQGPMKSAADGEEPSVPGRPGE